MMGLNDILTMLLIVFMVISIYGVVTLIVAISEVYGINPFKQKEVDNDIWTNRYYKHDKYSVNKYNLYDYSICNSY